MQAARPPFLRGILLLAALAAIAILMARGDSPAQATTYDPTFNISVSDPTPGAAADIVINFSANAPDAFPNVKTNSSIQFIPRQWGIHTPETDGANAAPVGAVAGTFNALTALTLGSSCIFPIPVPFTMIDASPYTGYDAATGAYDPQKLTSALDIGDDHPGGIGYSGQFAGDPDTLQVAGDVGLSLVNFTNPDVKHNNGNYTIWPPVASDPWTMDVWSTIYVDADHNWLVSPGDIRLTSSSAGTGSPSDVAYLAGTVVRAGDADISYKWQDLHAFTSDTKHDNADGNGQMDVGEGIYQDVNQPWLSKVSYGDVRLFRFSTLGFGSIVQDLQLNGGITRYPDFLNQMLPPSVVGEPLARQFGAKNVLGFTAVSLNIVTYRPGQLPGYPASLGYPNIVVLMNPVAPVDWIGISMTSDLCTPLSLISTNLGVSQDNPATLADEAGYVRLTNPKSEKSHGFTLITTSQPDADNDGIENMLDTCPLTPNTQDRDGRNNGEAYPFAVADPDRDGLDGACDPDPAALSPGNPFGNTPDQDQDYYWNRADNCATVPNGAQVLDIGLREVPGFVFFYGIYGDPVGPSIQTDTDGDDIGDACEGAEAGAQCANDVDDDADGAVNDGCPRGGDVAGETGAQCLNATDDDGDGWVNDGCPRVGSFEAWWDCSDNIDNDGDGYVNDGCKAVTKLGTIESGAQCDNNVDDDGDSIVNDGCPSVDPGDAAKMTITGHMHVVTLTQGVDIFKHGIKLNNLGGPKTVKDGGARTYSVDVSNLGSSAEDVQVGLRVVEGCAAVSGPSSVSVAADGSATASFTVDFTGCAAGTYTVQADACHAGDAAPAGLFSASGGCPGVSDGMTDPNPLDDAPIAKSVEVGSP